MSDFHITLAAHDDCDDCIALFDRAVDMARVTGSRGCTAVNDLTRLPDGKYHSITVKREVTA